MPGEGGHQGRCRVPAAQGCKANMPCAGPPSMVVTSPTYPEATDCRAESYLMLGELHKGFQERKIPSLVKRFNWGEINS